jgi:fluoride exporter
MQWLLVAVGGALGAMARFGLGIVAQRVAPHDFPYATFLINLSGCLVFGLLAGWSEFRAPLSAEARAFLLVGILGGFTTFSSFGYETFQLLRDGQGALAATNAAGQVLLGVAAVWLGWTLTRALA